MKGRRLKITFNGDYAYLSPNKRFLISSLRGFPDYSKHFEGVANWEVEVLKYEDGDLFVNVIKYSVGEADFSPFQLSSSNEIEAITSIGFKSVDTPSYLRSLKGRVGESPYDDISVSKSERQESFEPEYRNEKDFKPLEPIEVPDRFWELNEEVQLPIKKMTFLNGEIQFDFESQKLSKTQTLSISNDWMIEEYDAIKNYFEKVIGSKKVRIKVHLKMKNWDVQESNISSPELGRIDSNTIEEVKMRIVERGLKLDPDSNSNISTIEEFNEGLLDSDAVASLFDDDKDKFIERVLSITNSKHYNHLRYLSSKHSHKVLKLRVSYKPFSFLFLLEEKKIIISFGRL